MARISIKPLRGNYLLNKTAELLRNMDTVGLLFRKEVIISTYYVNNANKLDEKGLKITIKFDKLITIPTIRERIRNVKYVFENEFGVEKVQIDEEYVDTTYEIYIYIENC